MEGGFTGDMSLVTLGTGLVNLDTMRSKVVNAMMEDKSTYAISVKSVGMGDVITLVIHSEDGKGQDIIIKCNPTQRFGLSNGDSCMAKDLQGQRLISIGQNRVFCAKVIDYHEMHELFVPIKAEMASRGFVYINGIRAML